MEEQKKFKLLLNGQNVLVEFAGKARKTGFYQTLFVEAADPEEAESLAIDKSRNYLEKQLVVHNPADDPPRISLDDIWEIDEITEDDLQLEKGRTYYPEKRWWQFWK